MPTFAVLAASIALQLAAALLVIRLSRFAGGNWGGYVLALGFLAMALRRIQALVELLRHGAPATIPPAELLALLASLLLCLGIFGVRSYVQRSERDAAFRAREEGKTRAEQELRRIKAVHGTILENSPFGIVCLRNRAFEWANARWAEILGLPLDQIIGRSSRFMFPNDAAAEDLGQRAYPTMLGGQRFVDEVQFVRGDGSPVWCLCIGTFLDPSHPQDGSIWLIEDITEHREVRREVRRLNQFLESVVDSADVWMNALDEEARVTLWNRAAEAISGYGREEVLGQADIWQWLYPDEGYRDEITRKAAEIIRSGTVVIDFETVIRRKDGEERVISWSSRQLMDEKGHPAGSVAIGRDVTRSNQAEARLEQAMAIQSTLLANSVMGIALVRRRSFEWVNQKVADLLGRPLEELQGASTRILYPDEATFEELGRAMNETLAQGGRSEHELQLRRGDGSLFWCRFMGKALDPSKPDEASIWMFEDVTERVSAVEALKESREYTRVLFADSHIPLVVMDADTARFVDCNRAAVQIFGYTSRREVLGKTPWDVSAPLQDGDAEPRTAAMERIRTCRETGSVLFEWRHQRPNGEVWDAEVHLMLFWHRGRALIQFSLQDITDRKRAAEALRTSQEQLHLLLDSTAEAIYGIDLQGRCTFCNPACLRMLGYERAEQMLGRQMHDLVHHSFADGSFFPVEQCRIFQAFQTGEGTHVDDEVFWRADGTCFPAEYWSYPQRDKGVVVGAVIAFVDISERKGAEAERDQLMQELNRKNQELETLVYVASHDLRSPLVNVMGFGQRIEKSVAELSKVLDSAPSLEALREAAAPVVEERIPASLNHIKASGAKMDALINGLLRLSRAGRIPLRPETLDMDQMMAGVLSSTAFQLQSVGGKVALEPLPPCLGDAVQVNQIFTNLVDNAIKYRNPEWPLSIRISGQRQQDRAVYRVEDNGIGIPPEHTDRIFEIFQRLDPKGPVPGEGMGLTLVKRMVQRNGGEIGVESEPGRGSCFVVTLPAG